VTVTGSDTRKRLPLRPRGQNRFTSGKGKGEKGGVLGQNFRKGKNGREDAQDVTSEGMGLIGGGKQFTGPSRRKIRQKKVQGRRERPAQEKAWGSAFSRKIGGGKKVRRETLRGTSTGEGLTGVVVPHRGGGRAEE